MAEATTNEIIVRPPLVAGFQPDADEVHADNTDFSLEVMSDVTVWMAIRGEREGSRTAIVVAAEWKWWKPWRPKLRVIVREE